MTYRERLQQEHPEYCGEEFIGGCKGCPCGYGYEEKDDERCRDMSCTACWDREVLGE